MILVLKSLNGGSKKKSPREREKNVCPRCPVDDAATCHGPVSDEI